MNEERGSTFKSDHRVRGADLHRLGNFINIDARESLCCFSSRDHLNNISISPNIW